MVSNIQLGGTYGSSDKPLLSLSQKLSKVGIQAHPFSDGFIFTRTAGAPGPVSALWTPYESNLDYYESIRTSDLYLVDNEDGLIDEPVARGILFTLTQGKPIVLTHEPIFAKDVGAIVRGIITKNKAHFTLLNVFIEDEATIRKRLEAVTTPHYELGARDRAIIKAILRRHFRDLLTASKRESSSEHRPLAASAV